jgi:serine protease SohB
LEFLYDYGLFLAKTLTAVVALAVIIGLIVSAGLRNQNPDKNRLVITPLNERFDDMKTALQNAVLDDKALKSLAKTEKKAQKDKSKMPPDERKRVYVLTFDGDMQASQVDKLRDAITAVLTLARPTDEVVVKLESGGGLVHSYGLGASQLARFRDQAIPLTVCVDKVAASGGYMMACVANRVLAAPFAIIGSIGVVAQLPNFHRLLKKHDIDYEMLTAGKYKRTLTLLGENTDEGRSKFKEDLEATHALFKGFVGQYRPQLAIEDVATGEIWFGQQALGLGLIDELSTSDSYLWDLSQTADLFGVHFESKKSLPEKLGEALSVSVERSLGKLWQAAQGYSIWR